MTSKTPATTRPRAAAEPATLVALCVASWLVPGAGHLWRGRRQKGIVFLVALPLMFFTGLWLNGRIFPFDFSEPLVGLGAIAHLGNGLPWFLVRMADAGAGVPTSATYEYGYVYMIASGLLNFLVIIDAFDIAMGRK